MEIELGPHEWSIKTATLWTLVLVRASSIVLGMGTNAGTPTRREAMRGFLPHSPFVRELGIELDELETDRAVLRLPWRPELATIADVVHGGAVATLLDTAGMAAAWSDDAAPEAIGGATVAMSISYVSAARAADLVAVAEVVRRGGSLCFVDVTVTAGDEVVAKGMVTHRFQDRRGSDPAAQ